MHDLFNIIKNNFELLCESATQKKITLSTNIQENTIAFGDVNMVDTIFRNLISNSIKYSHIGGQIRITCETEDGFRHIKFIDNGVGIKEKDIEKLFRIDTSFTRKGTSGETGTGLGLVLVKEFLEKNKGNIRVESSEGKGAVMHVYLPADSQIDTGK
jgi:signal transduction histidine kinase